MKMRTFYPRHELTSAPFKTRDSSILEHYGAHSSLSTQSNCCIVRMKAAAVIGRRTESRGSSLVFSGKPFILPSSTSSQRHRFNIAFISYFLIHWKTFYKNKSSHPPFLRDTGFNNAFLSYFSIQWKSCHLYFLLPKTQFILKVCSIWSKNGMLPLKVMNKLIQLILFLILYHLCIHLDVGTRLWLKIYIYFTFTLSFILHSL